MDNSKACTKCGQTKPITDFRKDKRLKSGYGSQCKTCKYAQANVWVEKNYERKLEINRKWQSQNPELKALATKRWAERNAEYLATKNKAYRIANKEKLAWNARQWRSANKAAIAKANKEWRIANAEVKKLNDRNWWKNNPDKVKARTANRRARKKAATIYKVTAKDVEKIMSKNCFYCNAPSKHLDHVVPLFKGGSHSIGNLVAACQFCNLSKGKKFLSEWRYSTSRS